MSKYKFEKDFIFSQQNPDDAKRFLKDKHNLDLTQVVDEKNNNCLHQCAYQESLLLMQEYVNYQRIYMRNNPFNSSFNGRKSSKQKYEATESQINFRLKDWLNAKNNEGFTPLHFAAFKGDIQILKYLDKLGADHTIKTKSGLGMLHLSAQSDKIKTFIYYRNKIPINDLDDRKSTPLHWAAYSGSEKVTQYLLAQRAELYPEYTKNRKRKNKKNFLEQQDWINSQDIEKQTALHLATGNGNTKIVRRLLIAGAERHLKNNQNKQPIQIARENEFINIEQFLNDNYTWLDYVKFFMNVKIKYEPRNRSLKMPLLFFFMALLLVGTISYALDYNEKGQQLIFWIQEGFFTLLMLLYISLILHSSKLERGSYEKLEKIWLKSQHKHQVPSLQDQTIINSSVSTLISSNIELHQICLRCVQYKPRRSYHCDVCNTCITQYDHHCPWINNCIGKHNIGRFILFLVLLFFALNWILVISIHFILQLNNDENDTLGIFSIRPFVKETPAIMYAFVIISILLFIIFAVPLLLLIIVQVLNLYYGKTTYERLSKANQSLLTRSEQQFMGNNSGLSARSQRKGVTCLEMCISRDDDQKLLLA